MSEELPGGGVSHEPTQPERSQHRDDRGRRRRAGLWSIALTVLIGLVVAASVVVVQVRHDRDVATADRAARLAAVELGLVRAATGRELAVAGVGRPRQLQAVAVKRLSSVPVAPPVTAYAAEHSQAYRDVVQEREDLASSLRGLALVAKDGVPLDALLDAADAALAVRPTSLAPVGLQRDGAALRATVVVGMRDVLARFRAVDVPEGHEKVARAVEGALEHVITEAEALAARLDSGSGGSFAYAEQYEAAQQAVDDERTRMTGDLQEAVNAVVGNDSGVVPSPRPTPSTSARPDDPGQDV
ncbi:hypothetical protein ASD11_08700 [Aeromicrobium sp. Root495]|nr:hypothetical protein ASD11_08700 [Aeromicrobium sp. Root495]